ncbi:hypothetical protein, partial [Blautia obeum]|uniref:hypothetical protein n=1 Tax=Blautia obeum TaxID=40520 RepID=UPI001186B503
VETRWRVVSWFDGTPGAMKVARPVWSGGKGGDSFKTLPITIFPIYKDEKCSRYFTDGCTKKFRYVYEMPVHG